MNINIKNDCTSNEMCKCEIQNSYLYGGPTICSLPYSEFKSMVTIGSGMYFYTFKINIEEEYGTLGGD